LLSRSRPLQKSSIKEETSMPQTPRKAQNRSRLTTPLPETLHRHLRDYANAAKGASRPDTTSLLSGVTVSAAVGLGILALPPLASTEVVYTPTNQSVNEQQRKLQIDFNHDGIPDASLSVQGYCNSGSGFRECFGSIFALGLQGNQAMTSGGFAAAAKAGKIIGHQDQFQDFPEMARGRSEFDAFNHTSSHTFKGPWVNVQHRYLGFKFTIDGETHYGWARLTTQGFPSYPSAQLTGYAYETVANQPIVAGIKSSSTAAQTAPQNNDNGAAPSQPLQNYATLGVLAAGAPAINHVEAGDSPACP
jgi:hypothetical protein